MKRKHILTDIRFTSSYNNEEIGSLITTNYIKISRDLSVRQAMRELIKEAGNHNNISTIYVVDQDDRFYGTIDLKDLIAARKYDALDNIITRSHPYLLDHEKISEKIEKIKEYAQDSLPVLTGEGKIIGILTSRDMLEAIDDEMGDDYAKLGGLTKEEDLKETTKESMKKRLPWLVILLFLGMGVSAVVGAFENIVAVLPIIICFQSLILDMTGNVGTQSLAVTIRVLVDAEMKRRDKLSLIIKELKIGLGNGVLLGVLSLFFLGIYIYFFKNYQLFNALMISGCVGAALLVSMAISSLVGTLIPLFFHKVKVDPAIASGPLITTVNDLVAVVTYYGLAWILLIHWRHLI